MYEYFASKDEILHALLREGFRILAASMEYGQHSTEDVSQQVVRVSEAYWQFARDNPDLYQVMHGLGGVAIDNAARAEAVQAVCAIAEGTLVAWAKENQVLLPDPLGSTEIMWSLLHGLVSLTLIDRLDADEGHAKQLLSNGIQALLQGWKYAVTSI